MRGGSDGRLLVLWNCGSEIASSSSSIVEDMVRAAGRGLRKRCPAGRASLWPC